MLLHTVNRQSHAKKEQRENEQKQHQQHQHATQSTSGFDEEIKTHFVTDTNSETVRKLLPESFNNVDNHDAICTEIAHSIDNSEQQRVDVFDRMIYDRSNTKMTADNRQSDNNDDNFNDATFSDDTNLSSKNSNSTNFNVSNKTSLTIIKDNNNNNNNDYIFSPSSKNDGKNNISSQNHGIFSNYDDQQDEHLIRCVNVHYHHPKDPISHAHRETCLEWESVPIESITSGPVLKNLNRRKNNYINQDPHSVRFGGFHLTKHVNPTAANIEIDVGHQHHNFSIHQADYKVGGSSRPLHHQSIDGTMQNNLPRHNLIIVPHVKHYPRISTSETEGNMIGRRAVSFGESIDQQHPSSTGNKPILGILKLNVGGTRFLLLRHNLELHPDTLLGKMAAMSHEETITCCDAYLKESGEYFFDRSAACFEEIANFYRTNTLHAPDNICKSSFQKELTFWGLSNYTAHCNDHSCRKRSRIEDLLYNTATRGRVTRTKFSVTHSRGTRGNRKSLRHLRGQVIRRQAKKLFHNQPCSKIRSTLWTGLEEPFSSKTGMFLGAVSLFFILATVILLVIGSLPDFQVSLRYYQNNTLVTQPCYTCMKRNNNTTLPSEYAIKEIHPFIELADMICVSWFTFEYLLRIWTAPSVWKYIMSPLSIIDLLSILPSYGEIIAKSLCFCDDLSGLTKSMLALRVLRVLRVFRVLRVLKLARYSIGIQMIGTALKRSIPELCMLSTFVFIVTVLFATIIYYVEDGPETQFTTIPQACWWCIVTFTTVGYGDIVPTTVLGKIVATAVSFCGVVILAFPVSIIVDKFNRTYMDVKGAIIEPEDSDPKLQQSQQHQRVHRQSGGEETQFSLLPSGDESGSVKEVANSATKGRRPSIALRGLKCFAHT